MKWKTILVIDDDSASCRTIARYLVELADDVQTATTVSEAIEKLSAHTPDVIVSDYYLGSASALDILEWMKEEHLQIPTLFVTGSVDRNRLLEIESVPFFDIVEKPVDRETLRRKLSAFPAARAAATNAWAAC